MRPLGLLRELEPKATAALPPLEAVRGGLAPAAVDRVVDYLRSAPIVADALEITTDPLDPSVRIAGGSGLHSDGEWVWRQDLWHYVARYRIALAADFLARVQEGRPPADITPAEILEAMRVHGRALRA